MKKISLLAVLLAAFSASTAMAQTDSTATALQEKLDSLQNSVAVLQKKEDDRSKTEYDNAVWKRKAHLMIGFSTQKMTDADNADDMQYKSKMGFVLDWGKTFYLHKKPIANIMKVGIDWSWIDLSFAKYKSGTAYTSTSIRQPATIRIISTVAAVTTATMTPPTWILTPTSECIRSRRHERRSVVHVLSFLQHGQGIAAHSRTDIFPCHPFLPA